MEHEVVPDDRAGVPDDSPPLTTQPVKSAFELAWDAELPAGRDDGGYQFWAVVRHPVRIV